MELRFKALEWLTFAGRGDVAVVRLDREVSDFSHLLGQVVIVDGTPYHCHSVERFCHSPPWREGEKIGLWVGPC